ncbi:MAG TPA: DNA topoisomerase I [Nitrososphaerales archaeon]|nr:DNA topoisomerase I [Nitrososphaerales archaeon]
MSAYWKTLSHNGVNFPDPYNPDGLSVKVKGKAVGLSPLAEEMAYHLAKKKDTPYIQDPVFRSNFLQDFLRELPDWCSGTPFEQMDFSAVFAKVDAERMAKESLSKDEKKAAAAERKQRRDSLKARFGVAQLDGKPVDIANWMVEPPGLFMGRGQHPMRGRWKPRVSQSDVVLNLGERDPVPSGEWKEVVNDHSSMWMAKWIDKLTDKEKYVWLHESSPLQQSRNRAKYDKAAKVGKNLERIRDRIRAKLESKGPRERQVATVCYLIDKLGMRVGDEKDEDEADTVGASTLRVEHLKLKGSAVEFSFLGKDSVPWNKADSPPPAVMKNLHEFSSGKSPETEIFHHVSSGMVNQFLSSIVPGLSAKVFRTYHATAKAEEALRSKELKGAGELDKLYFAKEANLQAAVFCNHQRTPPKTWDQSLEKKMLKLEEARARPKASEDRIRKMEMEIDFYKRTKNYNLNTTLKNYIDPRLYKAWCDHVGMEWAKVYSKSLQKKFSWVEHSETKWDAPDSEAQAVARPARSPKNAP